MGSFSIVHWIITLILIAMVVTILKSAFGGQGSKSKKVCPACGTIADPVFKTRGTFAIEVVLWICLLVPGLIYSLWRLSSRYQICPACGASGMIPVDTPMGKSLAEKMPSQPETASSPAPPSNDDWRSGRIHP